MSRRGTLYVVATPIGNDEDLGVRARRLLDSVEVIACEDTRRARSLLRRLSIEATDKTLIAYFDHNEGQSTVEVLDRLSAGMDVAIISDAGTPAISDPGLELLRKLHDARINVVPVPGPSALTAVLSISPIAVNRFHFTGFLPRQASTLRRLLRARLDSEDSTVFFESPKRLLGTLALLLDLEASHRTIFIGRELTKTHEELFLGSIETVHDELKRRDRILGEIVCVLAGATEPQATFEVDHVIDVMLQEGVSPTVATRLVAKLTGRRRKQIYDRITAIKR